MTVGLEPKLIRTVATLHTLCITKGPLSGFKLFVRAYGGRSDKDLNKKTEFCGSVQKWVDLFNIMLDSFKHRGHIVTCDSVYLGEVMADVCQEVWGINILGTSQTNRNGANMTGFKKLLDVGTYESLAWQWKDGKLCYTIWSDNNYVKIFSNFHQPKRLVSGLMRKKKGEDRRQEREQLLVPCPAQNKTYSSSFHWIGKGNRNEAVFDLGGESHMHGWQPKIALHLLNMTIKMRLQIMEI